MAVIGITGISGYVGSRLATAMAADADTRVMGIDLAPPLRGADRIDFEPMDVRDARLIERFRQAGVTSVVHLACVFDPIHDREKARDVHVGGTRNVLAAAEACGASQVLFLSSTYGYGAHPDSPPRLREDHAFRPNPRCALASDQAEMERLVLAFGAAHPDVRVAIARCCTVLGPGANHFIARALQEPFILVPRGADPEIQFIHEDDLVAACLLILREGRAGVWNLVGEGTMRLSQCLARLGSRVRHLPSPVIAALSRLAWRLRLPLPAAPPGLLPYLTHPCVASGERAARELGFTARHGAAETLESYLKSFL
ncbi:MAG: NAD-dependent epimerase/dehydratase family protein [Deltaproteobacteria bacterium]|nr:NAD-dependent epimerase/dehydratase family protein [Deltaproteobacteria bacterium]